MPGFVKNHGILGRDALMKVLQQSKVNLYFLNIAFHEYILLDITKALPLFLDIRWPGISIRRTGSIGSHC